MNGLHSCKPGNEPKVGQVKTFVVLQMTGKSGKPYTKIKSASPEQDGTPFKITKVSPTGHTDSYGNISFNIEIEPASQPSQSNGSDPSDRSNRIERQHSQEMALRYFTLIGGFPSQGKDRLLRTMIDWFQRDIGHAPSAPQQRQTEPEIEPEEYIDGATGGNVQDEEIPF